MVPLEEPRPSLDFADTSVLEAVAPAASHVDIEHAFTAWDGTVEQEGASIVPFIKQRHVLLFDELLPVYVVFRTPLLEDEVLQSYLGRLAVTLDVFAFGTAPGPDQEAKALPKELIYSTTITDANEPTIVLHESDDGKHAYVFWKIDVPIARPQGRFHKPAIYFQPTASMKPDLTARKPSPHDDYLPSRIPPALNLLQSFEHDPALAGIHPRLSAMRISKIAPSTPLALESARPIKTGQRPLFRVVPPLMWRTRFAALPAPLADLSLLTSLDIEIASYTSYPVSIRSVALSLLGGKIETLSDATSTSTSTPTPSAPGDLLSFLYRATPDVSPDGAPALGPSHILTLTITATVHISPTCTPAVEISWKTPVDFASEARVTLLKAHRLSSSSATHRLSSSSSSIPPAAAGASADVDATPLPLTLTISGPPSVRVGSPFHWSLFIVNRTPVARRLAIMVLPRRKRDARPSSSSSVFALETHALGGAMQAPAVLDENIVYARLKGARVEAQGLVCLSTDVRLGLLAPGSCYTADLRFVALSPGAHAVECVRVVDLTSGETADVRDLPGVVASDDIA